MAVDKLVDSAQLDADLTTVANAIRTKGGTSASLAFPSGFASAIAAIPSGGGGASNIVTGTFTGTTTNAAMDITLNYTGDGYPLVVAIYPVEGAYNSSGTIYSLVQRYAALTYVGIKNNSTTAPTYTSTSSANNAFSVNSRYKGSATSATNYSQVVTDSTQLARDANPTATGDNIVKIRSKTKMSVFIANTSYGFAANIEYKYHVIYSS